jgi:hypothetical protein
MINRLNTFDVDVHVNGKLYRHNINIFNREVHTTNSFGKPMVLRLIQKPFDEKTMPATSLVKASTSTTSGLAAAAVSGLAGLAGLAVSGASKLAGLAGLAGTASSSTASSATASTTASASSATRKKYLVI